MGDESDYQRIPGSKRQYVYKPTGEIVSYHQYLKVHYGGLSSHQFAQANRRPSDKLLLEGYKRANGGYKGLSLALRQLKESKKGRERRLALISFYPNAGLKDDDEYLY